MREALGTVMVLAMLAGVAGCARPVGDFARAEPGVVHDDILPWFGSSAANMRDEPVSDFNLTDTEKRLRSRSWALVRPPHAADWIAANAVEFQRTRLLAPIDRRLDASAYYDYLRSTEFRSSEVRYTRLIDDMEKDRQLIFPFYRVAWRVGRDDRERTRAMRARRAVSADDRQNTIDRVAENKARLAWVWRAMHYRLAAYRIAIDKLQLETPSPLLFDVNRAWERLQDGLREARRPPRGKPVPVAAKPRRSRLAYYKRWGSDDVVPQK